MKTFKSAILAVLCIFVVAQSAYSLTIDLTRKDVFIRRGFEPQWLNQSPDEKNWKKIPVNHERRLTIVSLEMDEVPQRGLFSLKSYVPAMFTFNIPFHINEAELNKIKFPSLYLAYLGGNYEIFINGSSIHREWHVSNDGSIMKITNIRNLMFPIDPRIIRKGDNYLCIKNYGDPTYVTTGLYYTQPYVIGDISDTISLQSESVTLVLIFIYLFFGLYHLFLFLNRTEDRYTLMIGLFAVFLFIYQFTRTHAVYAVIDSVNILDRLELISLYMLIPLILSFIDYVQIKRLRIFSKAVWIFNIVLILITLPTPLPFTYDIQMIWHSTVLIPLVYILLYLMVYRMYLIIRDNYRSLEPGQSLKLLKSVSHGLFQSVTGNLFFGAIIMISCAVFDNIDRLYWHRGLDLTQYGFLILLFGTTVILTNDFISAHRKVNILNVSLKQKVDDLNTACEEISHSEEKYRILVESSDTFIFTIDSSGYLLTANNTMMKELNIDPAHLSSYNISDFIYDDRVDRDVTIRLIKDKIIECRQKKGALTVKTFFKSLLYDEPQEMMLRMEYIKTGKGNELLVRASHALQDSLLKYLISENQTFSIDNHFTIAEEITQRLVRNVERYFDSQKIMLLRISLREIVINAIEHGNLEITFDEKTRAINEGDYLEYIGNRQKKDHFKNRKVTIDYELSPDRVAYTISDEGKGFEHESLISEFVQKANEELLTHGRGINMAMNFFDAVEYSDNGTTVTLVKYFN